MAFSGSGSTFWTVTTIESVSVCPILSVAIALIVCRPLAFSLGRNKTTSVIQAEVEECCSVLAAAQAEKKSPTGLLMQAIFQDTIGRKTKG